MMLFIIAVLVIVIAIMVWDKKEMEKFHKVKEELWLQIIDNQKKALYEMLKMYDQSKDNNNELSHRG